MNEEEKKALAFLRFYVSDDEDEYFSRDFYIEKNIIETILNLIEKQQKEIEKLDKENTRQQELIGNIHQKWKDKIREIITEFIPKSNHEVVLRAKLIKLLGE